MPIFALLKFLALFLLGLAGTLIIGLVFPLFLAVAIVFGLVGFRIGKSTKVPVNPRDGPFSPMRKLSYRDFDWWAKQNNLIKVDPTFFSRQDVHWTEKLPVLLSSSDAAGHCFEPSRSTFRLLLVDLALAAFVFFPLIHEIFGPLNDNGSLFFQFICGLALGHTVGKAAGRFYRWFRAVI